MTVLTCTTCSSLHVKKNGHTHTGKQRYKCCDCAATFTLSYTRDYKDFDVFIRYILNTHTQRDQGIPARTLRSRITRLWQYWPLPSRVYDSYDVVFVDGIYLKRDCVILIACTCTHIIGWYIARSENTRAWASLLSKISAPTLVVSDGGAGFRRACRQVWPSTKIQRCLFHVYNQIKTLTTLKPRLQAGRELLHIAEQLLIVTTNTQAYQWVTLYHSWYKRWEEFLEEKTFTDNTWRDTHQRLVKASRILNTLIQQNQLFTNLDERYLYTYKNHVIRTNNQIEGGVNAQLRILLHAHRGMSLEHQIKIVFWYCYMHSPFSKNPREFLHTMPTNQTITRLYTQHDTYYEHLSHIPSWGTTPTWQELHTQTPYT